MKKRKRFYKNVKRNQVWTEEAQGREIDFADKYSDDGTYSDKFDYLRPKKARLSKRKRQKEKLKKYAKIFSIAVISFVILAIGYTVMDVYMIRHRMPDLESATFNSQQGTTFSQVSLNLNSEYISSSSLDFGDLLNGVIDDATAYSFSSVAFDIKRADGTIGYKSALSNVDSYTKISSPATKLKASVDELKASDILAVGIVYCYLDNSAPEANHNIAVKNKDGSLYKDSSGNTYLNPDSDVVFGYIRDIILEANSHGITTFVLKGTDLPSDISSDYSDGFDLLATRLYDELGTNIKFIKPINVQLSENAVDDESDEIAEKLSDALTDSQVYYIRTSADNYLIRQRLDENGVLSYILDIY